MSDTWKGFLALLAALTMGGVATLTLVGFVGLPDRVAVNESGIVSNGVEIAENRAGLIEANRHIIEEGRKLDRIICILEARETGGSVLDCEIGR